MYHCAHFSAVTETGAGATAACNRPFSLGKRKTSRLADVGDTQGSIHHCSNYLTNVLCFNIVTMLFLQPVVYLLFIMHLSCSSLAVYVQQDLSAQQYALVLTVISLTAKLYLEGTLKKNVALAKIIIKVLVCLSHFSGVLPQGVELGGLLKMVINSTEKGQCLLFI